MGDPLLLDARRPCRLHPSSILLVSSSRSASHSPLSWHIVSWLCPHSTPLYRYTASSTKSQSLQRSDLTLPGTTISWEQHAPGSLPSTSVAHHIIQPYSLHVSPPQPLGSGTEASWYICPRSSRTDPSTCPCSSCRPLAASPSHSCTAARLPDSCRSVHILRCPRTSPILGAKSRGGRVSDAFRPSHPDPWLPQTHIPHYNNGAHSLLSQQPHSCT